MNTTEAVRPGHVPAELVYDLDVYDLPIADDDYHLAWKKVVDAGVPDIFWTPRNGGHWVAARGEVIHHIFKDFERFSSAKLVVPKARSTMALYPISIDPPDQQAYRGLISPFFMPKAIQLYEEKVRALAIGLIDGFRPRGECEFVSDFAQHLPIGIFMSMVDLPADDREMLLALADGMVRPVTPESVHETLRKIFEYCGAKIAERRARPGEDLISRLTRAQVKGRPLSDYELTSMCALVLIGGLDTVASLMGFVARFLALSPAHRKRLVDETQLIPQAVEELLRRFPVVNQGRIATHDFVYNGVQFKEGDQIILPTTLHALDEKAFKDACDVDFDRPSAANSTFGNGFHRCPGAFLARMELKVFLEEWLVRIPEFGIKPGARVGVRAGVNGTLHTLPLSWNV